MKATDSKAVVPKLSIARTEFIKQPCSPRRSSRPVAKSRLRRLRPIRSPKNATTNLSRKSVFYFQPQFKHSSFLKTGAIALFTAVNVSKLYIDSLSLNSPSLK